MKLVTFNRTMRGLGNPALIMDEALIARLQAEGAVASVADWPAAADRPAAAPVMHKPQSYLTKTARRLKGASSVDSLV